ncbi:hypothetical protein Cni_G20295 [Canna indica]|uniref:Uncharacterized protein n=1 Tax=Canna indica TaxID=4628 RepID=A0AAQ3KM96_9LILI|nr:hypothetical protein Cni_G20295 [Canna indica]
MALMLAHAIPASYVKPKLSSPRATTGGGGLSMVVECSSRPQKKATAHHMKTRPKKRQQWDVKRKGPTAYPPLPVLPPDWTLVSSSEEQVEVNRAPTIGSRILRKSEISSFALQAEILVLLASSARVIFHLLFSLSEDPEVTVLDPSAAVQQLHNCHIMLQDVADLNLSDYYGKVHTPRELVSRTVSSSVPDEREATDLVGNLCMGCSLWFCFVFLPFAVVKPLVVDGSAKSHEPCLAYDEISLSKQWNEPSNALSNVKGKWMKKAKMEYLKRDDNFAPNRGYLLRPAPFGAGFTRPEAKTGRGLVENWGIRVQGKTGMDNMSDLLCLVLPHIVLPCSVNVKGHLHKIREDMGIEDLPDEDL